ncbi:MAG: phosphoribosylanthranilate isomerase [Leptolyngbyaceae cyanobacterium MO_188.B28]|nr:phosphoribosylanthranilate isomerase [Leptolyngbyaceae cyanobacterium MO_188.B28]
MRVKICGITRPDQGRAIAQLGATALGFICVPQSPRYVSPQQIRSVVEQLSNLGPGVEKIDRIGVFVNADPKIIEETVAIARLSGVQLHGDESLEYCQDLRQRITTVEIIKAFRVKNAADLGGISAYLKGVDAFLLDAYHPDQLGGTGQTLDWRSLQTFQPGLPWFLAGGLNPNNIQTALSQISPDGVDLSSGVEKSPGDKDLEKVSLLFERLRA